MSFVSMLTVSIVIVIITQLGRNGVYAQDDTTFDACMQMEPSMSPPQYVLDAMPTGWMSDIMCNQGCSTCCGQTDMNLCPAPSWVQETDQFKAMLPIFCEEKCSKCCVDVPIRTPWWQEQRDSTPFESCMQKEPSMNPPQFVVSTMGPDRYEDMFCNDTCELCCGDDMSNCPAPTFVQNTPMFQQMLPTLCTQKCTECCQPQTDGGAVAQMNVQTNGGAVAALPRRAGGGGQEVQFNQRVMAFGANG